MNNIDELTISIPFSFAPGELGRAAAILNTLSCGYSYRTARDLLSTVDSLTFRINPALTGNDVDELVKQLESTGCDVTEDGEPYQGTFDDVFPVHWEGEEAILDLGDELCDKMGWKEGDTLEWKTNEDGSITLSKKVEKPETELVLVETVQMFRHRYLVEVPKGKADWALDSVTCEEVAEMSQRHLGETITSHWVVTKEEALELFDQDNEYLESWDDDKKLMCVHKIEDPTTDEWMARGPNDL